MGSVRRSSATARLAANEEIITCVTPKPRLDDILARVPQSVVVCGHTHVQFDRTHSGKRIVNAGSVGMPYERERGAYWVLLGPDVTLRRTGYDIEKAAILFGTTAFPGSGEFARDLLSPPDPDDTSEYFEKGGPGARSTRLNAVVENLGDCVSQRAVRSKSETWLGRSLPMSASS